METKKTLKQKLDSPIWILVGAFIIAGAMPLLSDGDGPCNTCVPLTQIGQPEMKNSQDIFLDEMTSVEIFDGSPAR